MDDHSHTSALGTGASAVVQPTPGRGYAHGKAILFGEHSVLYGAPAIALPVPGLRVVAGAEITRDASVVRSAVYSGRVDTAPVRLSPTSTALVAALGHFDATDRAIALRISSDIPVARGLGSSAAVASAVVSAVAAALHRDLSDDDRFALVQRSETVAHGTPSGLDARAVVADAPLWFDRGTMTSLTVGRRLSFVLADTGVASGTRGAVAAVRARHDARPAETVPLIEGLGETARAGRDLLARGDIAGLGAAMDDAHERLAALGVSSAALDRLASVARRAGARGAKLTGGGQGGCLIVLADDDEGAARIGTALRAAGAAAAWTTTVAAA